MTGQQIQGKYTELQGDLKSFLSRLVNSDEALYDAHHALFYRKLAEIQEYNKTAIEQRMRELKTTYNPE